MANENGPIIIGLTNDNGPVMANLIIIINECQ
jgi:hypothetical protein